MMTRVWPCCSRNYARRHCKLPKGVAKYQRPLNSNSFCKWRGSSAEWARHSVLVMLIYNNHTKGCHVLALDLVRSWSFAKPSLLVANNGTASPTPRRVFAYPAIMRRSSMWIDMDLTSIPSTPKPSPERNGDPRLLQPLQEESDLVARRAGIGKLINSAKQDVQVPEFDMNLFF